LVADDQLAKGIPIAAPVAFQQGLIGVITHNYTRQA